MYPSPLQTPSPLPPSPLLDLLISKASQFPGGPKLARDQHKLTSSRNDPLFREVALLERKRRVECMRRLGVLPLVWRC